MKKIAFTALGATAVALTGALAGVSVLAGGASAAGVRAAAPSCSDPLPVGSESVTLDQANFVATIDNSYWPITAGSGWVYQETDGKGVVAKVHVDVLDRTKIVDGIETTVARDTVSVAGEVTEDTRDWYAQDVCDNIWYLGENTKEYENGQVVSTEGSWQAGVDGALAGVVVPGTPTVGVIYREEYHAGDAEDSAAVLSLDEQTHVPSGHYTDVMLTHNFTPLAPKVLEYKLYAPGIGPVEEIGVSGGSDRAELVRYHLS